MTLAYLTHPLGDGDGPDHASRRGDNMAGAIEWFRFLIMATRWAVIMPWFVYVVAIDDEFHRRRAFRDQHTILSRSDLLIMAGGWISPHMHIDRRFAYLIKRIPTLDLTDLGVRPPWDSLDKAGQEIARRAAALGVN